MTDFTISVGSDLYNAANDAKKARTALDNYSYGSTLGKSFYQQHEEYRRLYAQFAVCNRRLAEIAISNLAEPAEDGSDE